MRTSVRPLPEKGFHPDDPARPNDELPINTRRRNTNAILALFVLPGHSFGRVHHPLCPTLVGQAWRERMSTRFGTAARSSRWQATMGA